MNAKFYIIVAGLLLGIAGLSEAGAQKADSTWTLQGCIAVALEKNIQIQKSSLTNEVNAVNVKKANQSRFPDLQANVGQRFSWSRKQDVAGDYGNNAGSGSTTADLSTSVVLFNGFRINNSIRQSQINYEAGKYNTEAAREAISLNILDAYLQVLYAGEQVRNAQKQAESTQEQLKLAEARYTLGAISKSDYLQVKSQLAIEKQTVATAESQLAIGKVTLMQPMELPVTPGFEIYHPALSGDIIRNSTPTADSVYWIALEAKPQIKSAALNMESSELNTTMARAGYLPSLTANAGIGTGYNKPYPGGGFSTQFNNRLSPYIGISLSIPIYNNRQARSQVDIARINTSQAGLDLVNTRNQLRKSIEQATVDISSAEREFEAGLEGYAASNEAYQVASEKYAQGLINAVDLLIQKTNLINAESKLLQARYNLIYSYKTLDFYMGIPLGL